LLINLNNVKYHEKAQIFFLLLSLMNENIDQFSLTLNKIGTAEHKCKMSRHMIGKNASVLNILIKYINKKLENRLLV